MRAPECPSRLPFDPVIHRALGEAWIDARLGWRMATGWRPRALVAVSHLAGLLRILGRAVVIDLGQPDAWKAAATVTAIAGLMGAVVLLPSVVDGLWAFPRIVAPEFVALTSGLAPVAAYFVALGSAPRRPRLFVLLVAGALPGAAAMMAAEGVRALAVVPFIVGFTTALILIADRVLLDTRRWAASMLAPVLPLVATALYARAALALTPPAPGGRTVSVGWFFLLSLSASWWCLVRRQERQKASAALARH